jgi:hypothetical protein
MPISDLIPTLPGFDEAGRFYSPFIERGSDGSPESVPIPSLADLKLLDPDELAVVAGRFGWQDTWDTRMEAMTSTLQAFGYDPDTNPERWDAAMVRMKVAQEKALLGVARRMSQRYETLEAVGGDMGQLCIYVNESDAPCAECDALGGTVKTYAEFVADGDCPGDRCLGGNNCMCALMAY